MPRKMTLAAYCAMTCNEGGFHAFLREQYGEPVHDNSDAADTVRAILRIESRRELDQSELVADRWRRLKSEYDNWLRQ